MGLLAPLDISEVPEVRHLFLDILSLETGVFPPSLHCTEFILHSGQHTSRERGWGLSCYARETSLPVHTLFLPPLLLCIPPLPIIRFKRSLR